jgi:hypothetical protein
MMYPKNPLRPWAECPPEAECPERETERAPYAYEALRLIAIWKLFIEIKMDQIAFDNNEGSLDSVTIGIQIIKPAVEWLLKMSNEDNEQADCPGLVQAAKKDAWQYL